MTIASSLIPPIRHWRRAARFGVMTSSVIRNIAKCVPKDKGASTRAGVGAAQVPDSLRPPIRCPRGGGPSPCVMEWTRPNAERQAAWRARPAASRREFRVELAGLREQIERKDRDRRRIVYDANEIGPRTCVLLADKLESYTPLAYRAEWISGGTSRRARRRIGSAALTSPLPAGFSRTSPTSRASSEAARSVRRSSGSRRARAGRRVHDARKPALDHLGATGEQEGRRQWQSFVAR